jgi:hypothetical protein
LPHRMAMTKKHITSASTWVRTNAGTKSNVRGSLGFVNRWYAPR